ncbi:MAG TPA: TolC family protein, partial [Candidatus Hydrogenedentes bacterium]|nr:TolC family protein [Candidatus Hydrogenedentota bacterium]
NARQEQAAIVYEQTILVALGDVENSLAAFANEQIRIDSLRASVETSERAFRIANERYLHGLEGYLSVLQAQQNLYAAQDQLIQSRSFALTDLVSLYKSLGGGWERAVRSRNRGAMTRGGQGRGSVVPKFDHRLHDAVASFAH